MRRAPPPRGDPNRRLDDFDLTLVILGVGFLGMCGMVVAGNVWIEAGEPFVHFRAAEARGIIGCGSVSIVLMAVWGAGLAAGVVRRILPPWTLLALLFPVLGIWTLDHFIDVYVNDVAELDCGPH